MCLFITLFYITLIAYCRTQFAHDQLGFSHFTDRGHPAVVQNSQQESQLPPELLKSSAILKSPHTISALARDSWFTSKEMAVIDREAEKIPRDMVYKLFKNAGWIKRR